MQQATARIADQRAAEAAREAESEAAKAARERDKAGSAPAGPAAGRARGGLGAPSEDVETVGLRDLVAVMERDPLFSRTALLYSLVNKSVSANGGR
ncbi:hypothetical protein H632_c2334p1 [Helicosporidium sp. ATCC 50920]|nr:hypothetical protein H632_c2334p1 [Helicosporidium sp. ATCC 50920]|eukprot:KDD73294.1 hypothetical protein H632_c2334p1 [Helicosporidium sp. ATCC 50920]